jgi:hypothetical protein
MSFTNVEKVAIRKFCGYGVKTPIGLTLDGDYGRLEFVLNNMDDDEANDVRVSYLSNLQDYESAILLTADSVDTAQAAVWTRNPKELQERTAIYNGLRKRLCEYIGIAPGPGLNVGGKIVRC